MGSARWFHFRASSGWVAEASLLWVVAALVDLSSSSWYHGLCRACLELAHYYLPHSFSGKNCKDARKRVCGYREERKIGANNCKPPPSLCSFVYLVINVFFHSDPNNVPGILQVVEDTKVNNIIFVKRQSQQSMRWTMREASTENLGNTCFQEQQ